MLIGAEFDRQPSYSSGTTFTYLQACARKAITVLPFLRQPAGAAAVGRRLRRVDGLLADHGASGVDGFLLSTGWGTWGFKAIPAAGEQLAELIATGRTPELIAPFGLDRFAREAAMADPSSAGTR